jgi:rod shape determining protein RodA
MKHENDLNKPSVVIRAIVLIGLPLFLVFSQPDLKNTLTITAVFVLMYFIAGLSWNIFWAFLPSSCR